MMKKNYIFLKNFFIFTLCMFLSGIIYAQTPLGSTEVGQALKRDLDGSGKWNQITFADDTTQTTATTSGAPTTATFITQTPDAELSAEQALNALGDGLLKHASGVVAQAVSGTDYSTPTSTDTLTNKTFDANGTGNSLSNIDVTDLANGTDGELITWAADATATTVVTGSSGEVLTSNGTGAAPTFQPALGSNVLINADFNIWQRGTSFAAIASNTYSADRFIYQEVGASVHTVSRDTDVPTVAESNHLSKYSIKVDCTTVDTSVAAGDYALIAQRIEGYNFLPLAQQATTLSFWHKHTKTGTYCIAVRNSGADRSYVAEYTQTTTDTWEKATINITASPSAGTWDYTTGIGLEVRWAIFVGTDFHGTVDTWESTNDISTSNQVNAADSTDNNFRLAQVKHELGSVATRFIGEEIGIDLYKCKRYYHRFTGTNDEFVGTGYATSTSVAQGVYQFPVTMRAAPTGGTNAASAMEIQYGVSNTTSTAIAYSTLTTRSVRIDVTGTGTPLTAGDGAFVRIASSSDYLDFDAEL